MEKSEPPSSRDASPPRFEKPLISTPSPISGHIKAGSIIMGKKEALVENKTSDVQMMKERYAKLLLGEDMSGGGKGVSTALAISNAITNLSASVFGELWRLQPLEKERRKRWQREMELLLAVSDHIVEFVPSCQTSSDGSIVEVMVTKPRSDLHMNLPALYKLDAMLLECLDSFEETEFWYAEQGLNMTQNGIQNEKWWLPSPKVPVDGLSIGARKHLQDQRECMSQILKAVLSINGQVLSEMEVPVVYWDALPKSGKSRLGETMYHIITSDQFSPEPVLSLLEFWNEHKILEFVNRLETAAHIWRHKIRTKISPSSSSSSWASLTKDSRSHVKKWEVCAERAQTLLTMLRHKFPGLPQTILDITKIQYNKDVGQSIIESYSRVLESLAFNILSRLDDVLRMDDLTKCETKSLSLCRSASASPCYPRFSESSPANKLNGGAQLAKSSSVHSHSLLRSPIKKSFASTHTQLTLDKGLELELRQM